MEILPMKAEHTERLAELEKLCFSAPWSRQALLDEVKNPSACFVTALEDDVILGYGGMHGACGEFYIDNIAVFPHHRSKGVGAALLKDLCARAQDLGGEFISLEVRPSNEGALRLYARLGFQEVGRRKNFYTGPEEDGLILTKYFERGTER